MIDDEINKIINTETHFLCSTVVIKFLTILSLSTVFSSKNMPGIYFKTRDN